MGFIKKMFDHFKQTATATEINKITCEDDTLQIGDIVLLYWIDTNNGDFFPSYFEQEYKINPQLHRNKLIRLGLLTFQKSEKSLSKLKVAELKEILKAKSLPVSGKKYDLIQRIMNNFDLLEDSIPSSICTTNTGQQILINYEGLIRAHKDPYISAIEYMEYSENDPYLSYDIIKIKILNDRINNNINAKLFGLVRNDCHAFGCFFLDKKDYKLALKYFIETMLFDCSGLSNSYEYIKGPIYSPPMTNSYVVTTIRNIAEECDLDDYNSAFELAKKEIESLRKKMFLTEGDFSFIKGNLLTEDLFVIEEYLKKYSEFAL